LTSKLNANNAAEELRVPPPTRNLFISIPLTIMSELNLITILSSNLPPLLAAQLESLRGIAKDANPVLENIIRFVSGIQPSDLASQQLSLAEWETKQAAFSTEIYKLKQTRQLKRSYEDVDSHTDSRDGEPSSNKKKRTDDAPVVDAEDIALYTLHSVSVTSPIRKKCDIIICRSSIRFYNATSQALETSISIASLKRAFVLPTKGKQKPHWTVVLMSSDAAEQGKKAASDTSNPQIIFGMDAKPTTVFKCTDHTQSSDAVTMPKSSPSLPPIQAFLSHLPDHTKPIIQPSTSTFCSKLSDSAGVDTYRSAKPGTLWFLKEGILWGESKPCEFWALEDLHGEGLRILSATGRTCSVYLIRRPSPSEDKEDFEDEGIETEFSMVDGKEQDAIRDWIRNFKGSFGAKDGQRSNGASTTKEVTAASKPETSQAMAARTAFTNLELGSDSEDDNYETDSDNSHGGSSALGSSSEDSDAEDDGDDSASEGEAQESGEVGDEKELDAAKHPLMKPGAMPRMSKAAMEMVVSMVEDDLMGDGTAETPHELGSDEDDELE
jgi:hypothetical protein